MPFLLNAQSLIEVDGLYYTIENEEAKLTKNDLAPYSGAIVIPETIEYSSTTYNVTKIDENTFNGNNLITSISIPGNVAEIGANALLDCSALESITVNESNQVYDSRNNCNAIIVKANDKLLFGCKNAVFPADIKIIGSGAFKGCIGLLQATLPEGLTTIEDYGFSGCSALGTLSLPYSLTTIGEYAFQNCDALTSFTIPKYVSSIGSHVIDGCSQIATINSQLAAPFDLADDVFSATIKSNVTLNIPSGSLTTYQAAQGWDFTTIVEDPNLCLYTLLYQVDGVDYKKYEIIYNQVITPEAAPTKEGYTFSGWSDIPATMPAENVTITGTFSINNYNLIYKVDGVDYKTVPTVYNSAITPEAAPTKEGYTFSGWSSIPATMPAEDVTITGTFTVCKYNLTYKLDGNVYQTSEVDYGTPLTPIANPSVGLYYTFSGWSEVPATMPAHDVDITGSKVPKKYNLIYKYSYSSNLFEYTTYKTVEVEYGATITPEPNATQEGYTFSGWSGIPATMPGYDVTAVGLFTANFYTLTYQVNGKAPISYSLRYGSTITPEAAPTVDGFTFNGWVDLPATMPAHDVTVNASLTKNTTSSVTYPADWNLTEWSEETVSNMETDTKWVKSEYRYRYLGSCPKNESIELSANGVKIKETAGVEFTVSNCSMFTISTKAGGLYNVNIEVYKPEDFFFVLKNMKRGQKVSIDFGSVDWYTDNDLFPQAVGAVKMTDSPTTRAIRSKSSIAEYVVSNDGDVRFNVNADTFFYLYNVDVTAVSDAYLSYLSNPDGINNQIDCYLYWNGKSSSISGSWGGHYARGADVRIENKSNQTMTITRIELYDGTTSLKTVTDQNGDINPGDFKEFTFDVSSNVEMPETLPWMEVYYDVNGVSYMKKFVSDGKGSATGINGLQVDGDNNPNDEIYTIDGKKLSSYPTKKGLYIKNGKKFVVK